MKKTFLLTLLLTLCGLSTAWAEFNPEKGKIYALKSPSGTYFNFTKMSDGTEASFQDTPTCFTISKSGNGYIFEDYEHAGKYIGVVEGWAVGTTVAAVLTFSEVDVNGYISISTDYGGLGHDEYTTVGTGIYTNAGTSGTSECNKWLIEEICLYALKSDNNNADTYFNFTETTTTQASFQATPTFFYKIPSGNFFYLKEYGSNEVYLGYPASGEWSTTKDKSLWKISAAEENGFVSIERGSGTGDGGGSKLGSDTDTNVGTGIFTNVGEGCNKWNFVRAYPITVVYEFNGVQKEVNDVVCSGDTYIIGLLDEYADKVIASCTATNGVSPQKVDGVWSAIVNAATTITVTLRDKGSIIGNGKVGTINVADINGNDWTSIPASTAWTISMEVENPNGASYNEWGSSLFAIGSNAFPEKEGYRGLQFYLQSSTNGGKLNAVFDGGDHKIDNVTYTGNFSASISYNGNNLLQIKTTNASGTVAVNDYTLNNKLAEFSQLSYGLPTGINVKNLLIALLSRSVDYPTAGTESNGKYTFTSNKILYGGQCNKIRFTLTESGSKFQNGTNRMSLDEFKLYDATGKVVDLKAKYITGNNNKTYDGMLDGVNGKYAGTATWNDGTEDDWFEITLPNGIDLGGAFSFSFVTENTTMNAKAFRIDMSYVEPQEYTFNISGNGDNAVTVNHGDDVLTPGAVVSIEDFDVDAVTATEIPGYTWTVVIDDENYTVNVVYTACEVQENPASVVALVNRIGGDDTDDKFKFVLDPSINSKQETFVLGSEDDKILIKGTTISAITTGLGWYLNNVAHINISWNSLNEKTVSGDAYVDLSEIVLPLPSKEETHTSDAKYRYYLNPCTFGYSMTSWTWKRWQQEIDWMALHGINMPLQLVGLEEVWRTFLIKCGYSETDAKAFVAGPAFIAWWAMNNLQGWGGTAAGKKSEYENLAGAGGVQDDAWYARQKELAGKIVTLQRELGMQPVLPGWSGMVPTNFNAKTGYTTRGNGGNWAGDFVRPLLLHVNNAN